MCDVCYGHHEQDILTGMEIFFQRLIGLSLVARIRTTGSWLKEHLRVWVRTTTFWKKVVWVRTLKGLGSPINFLRLRDGSGIFVKLNESSVVFVTANCNNELTMKIRSSIFIFKKSLLPGVLNYLPVVLRVRSKNVVHD